MLRLTRLPALLLALNWLALATAFVWTCKVQGNVLWWLRLDWSGGLTEFSAMASMDMLPAGSVWLAWLAGSLLWTLVWLLVARAHASAPVPVTPATPTVEAARRQLGGVSSMMQSRPELKEKILKLHQSLEKL